MTTEQLQSGQRLCRKCGIVKALEDFYRSSRSKYGRQSSCKECHLVYIRSHPGRHRKPGPKSERAIIRARWLAMISRCSDESHKNFQNYGGRGITVCEEWRDFQTFMTWAVGNGWDAGKEIDRKDVNGNYEPSNCRFATHAENNLNRRKRSGCASIYIGVIRYSLTKKWISQIKIGEIRHTFGPFVCEMEAVKARNRFIIENGINASLNPEEAATE